MKIISFSPHFSPLHSRLHFLPRACDIDIVIVEALWLKYPQIVTRGGGGSRGASRGPHDTGIQHIVTRL